jgi:hypothetical protein
MSQDPNEDVTYTETTSETTTDTVLSVGDTPPCLPEEKISFHFKKDPNFSLDTSELYLKMSLEKVNWSDDEISYAWNTLANYQGIVNDWWRFLTGTVSNYNQKKKASEPNSARSYKSKTPKRSNVKCKTKITENQSISKKSCSENDMLERPWLKYKPMTEYL